MTENLASEIKSVSGATYPEIFAKFRKLSQEYGDLPLNSLLSAYNTTTGLTVGNMYTPNPYIQNRRIKGISTRPGDYGKNEVANFLQRPDSSERQLRAVEKGLEYTAYPMFHTRVVYQNLLTYHSYVAPHLTDREDAKKDDFWREWKLCEKLRCAINPKDKAHEFAGRALQEGKIFVAPRVSVDKSHNTVNHAFLQRLPSDWIKIVGYNNVSKYTVSFNLMYFCLPGTSIFDYGDLFTPYVSDWMGALYPPPQRSGKKVVYARNTGLNLSKVKAAAENVDAYNQNGRWFYWVELPVDRVFPMEIDDTEDNVLPPFAGLFLDLIQLSEMEQIQLEILQNPLVSVVLGQLETWNDKQGGNTADEYKISDAGRRFFLNAFYEMMAANNTSGIGIFAAPFKDMRLETLDEAPNAINIVSQGYTDTMSKAGLTAIIPVSDEARAGAVNVSLAIESRFPACIYICFERMMNVIISRMNLTYSFMFAMFGSLADDEKLEKSLKEQATLGILPAVIKYDALHDMSFLDDIAISDAIIESKILDRRIPLVNSYTMKQESSGLPPQGGRPNSEDAASSEGHEQDADGAETPQE